MRIELGVDSQGRSVAFDLDTLIRTRLLLSGVVGGKSWTTRRILEQSHGKVQHLVFDPEGEFCNGCGRGSWWTRTVRVSV